MSSPAVSLLTATTVSGRCSLSNSYKSGWGDFTLSLDSNYDAPVSFLLPCQKVNPAGKRPRSRKIKSYCRTVRSADALYGKRLPLQLIERLGAMVFVF